MDYKPVLEKTKFLFDWGDQPQSPELKVFNFGDKQLHFNGEVSNSFKAPKLIVSIRLGQRWHDHIFERTEWAYDEKGEVTGLYYHDDGRADGELKKSLELGLCV